MKILVCISSVPDTTSKINFSSDKTSFDTTGIQWVINPFDEFALSKAINIQTTTGATVTVIGVGGADMENVLRKALAIGANEAIRINTNPKDSYSTALEIANFAKTQNFDIIFTGKESIDYNGGAVPGMLAQMLDLVFVNAAIGLELQGNKINVTREIDGGKEQVSLPLPAVVAGQKGLVEEKDLIIPNMRGIMSARTKPLNVIESSTPEHKTSAVSFESVTARAAVKLVAPDQLDELVRLLQDEAKVI